MRFLLVSALAMGLAACERPADEEQIRRQLEAMTAAVAEGNARAFMAPIADDFSADVWQLDRRGTRMLLNREMRTHQRIRIRLLDVEVELVGEERAVARFHAVLTGGSGWLPEQGGWYRASTGWRRDGSQWQLITASWDRVAGR